MLRDILFLSILLAAVSLEPCEQCNYAISTDTQPTEGFYLQRANSTSNYTVVGFQQYQVGNRDYNSGPSLFYSKFLNITDSFLQDFVVKFQCQSLSGGVNISQKIQGIIQEIYDDVYPNGVSWLCTVPPGYLVSGVRAQLNIHKNQVHVVDKYTLMIGVVQIEKPSDIKSQVALLVKQVKRQTKRYNLTSLAFRQNIFQTTGDILRYLGEAIEINTHANAVKLQQMPNKIPLVEKLFPIVYTPGSKILLGRFDKANPNIIIIYSPQNLTECTQRGHFKNM